MERGADTDGEEVVEEAEADKVWEDEKTDTSSANEHGFYKSWQKKRKNQAEDPSKSNPQFRITKEEWGTKVTAEKVTKDGVVSFLKKINAFIIDLEVTNFLWTKIPNPLCEHAFSLRYLNLSHGRLNFPVGLGRLVNLEQLDLSYNDIEHVPSEFGLLAKLEMLSLKSNALTEISGEALKGMVSLRDIGLRYNSKLPRWMQVHLVDGLYKVSGGYRTMKLSRIVDSCCVRDVDIIIRGLHKFRHSVLNIIGKDCIPLIIWWIKALSRGGVSGQTASKKAKTGK